MAGQPGSCGAEVVAASRSAENVADAVASGGELGVRHVHGHPAHRVGRVGQHGERIGGELLRAALAAEVVSLAGVARMRAAARGQR